MPTPRIFISATSGDLRFIRQVVKEALLTINCHPVEQSNFEPNARTVEAMLRDKIGDCQALIHICGMRYGAEPDLATLPPGSPRRSYTQREYHIGRQLQKERGDAHFRVYTFICPEEFPYEEEPDTEPQEKRDLQNAHRSRLFDDPHLWEKPKDSTDLKVRILALQEQVLALKQQQAEVKTELIKNRHLGLKAFAVLLLLLGGLYAGIHFLKRSVETLPTRVEESIRKGYTVDASRIRIQLEAASKLKLDSDIVLANDIAKHPKWDDRQKLREEAEAAHQQRLSRVTEYAESFAELAAAQDASPVLIEMGRIIETEGVDAAIAYFETQRGEVYKRAKSRLSSAKEVIRRELQPSLKVAGLLATRGNSTAARASYEEILALEPDWPEAIDAFAWFLYDSSFQSLNHGSQRDALADAEAMHSLTSRRLSLAPRDPLALRLLSVAAEQVASVLIRRRQPGDAQKALDHFQRSLEVREKLLSTNFDSAEAARDVAMSLDNLGDFLARRDQPGDAVKALAHFHRSLEVREKLLSANLDSAEAARDVSVGLDSLGTFLARRGQSGDAEQALAHFQRSLEIREKLLTANPDSPEDARDLSVSLNKLGNFLARRGQPGDAQQALSHYQRNLEISENFLSANLESVLAARDVSISLYNLGDFLARRGQPGDSEQALGYYQRSLEISERLLSTNLESGLAARDVSLSLGRLGDFLVLRGQPGDAEQALRHFQRCLEIGEKLLRANPDSAEAASDVSISLSKLGTFLASRGQPGDAAQTLRHYQRSLEVVEKLHTANPDSAEAARDVSVSLDRLGDFFARRGQPDDGENSLACYQRSLSIAEKLLSANPDSAQAARDVSVRLNNLGTFLASRRQPGDAEKILGHCQRSLEIREKLLTANPDSAEAARDVSLQLNNLGAFLASRGLPGDVDKALGHYQRCLAIAEKLLGANPGSAEAARDVSVSLNHLGDFFTSRDQPGDAEQTISHFQRSIEIRQRLLSANPDSAQAARDLSVSINKLGDILASRKQPDVANKALGYFQQGLQIAEKLLTANPDSAEAARDVSFSLERLGHFLARRDQPGDAKKALSYFQRSLEIREKLLTANPDSAEAARDVSVSMNKLGDYFASRDQPEEAKKALSYYQGCLKISEKLLSADPDSASAARDVAFSHYRLSAYCNGWGDTAGKKKHRRACYEILAPCIARGMNFDPPILKLFQELKKEFGAK